MKRRLLKTLYFLINGSLTLVALHVSKKYISPNDNNFVARILSYSIVILLLYALNHWIFMRVAFGNDNNKSE